MQVRRNLRERHGYNKCRKYKLFNIYISTFTEIGKQLCSHQHYLYLGELLAAFEMFELAADFQKIPDLPNVKDEISDFGPAVEIPRKLETKT